MGVEGEAGYSLVKESGEEKQKKKRRSGSGVLFLSRQNL